MDTAQLLQPSSIVMVFAGLVLFIVVVIGTLAYFLQSKTSDSGIHWSPLEAIAITIAGYFIAQVLTAFLLVGVSRLPGIGVSLEDSFMANLFVGLVFYSLYGLLVVSFIKKRRTKLQAIGWVSPVSRDLGIALLGLIIYMFLGSIITHLTGTYTPIDINQRQELGFDTSLTNLQLMGVFLSLVIIAPLVEEVVMRGFLYSGLRTRLSFLPAAVITSVLFAVAHLQLGSGNPPLWVAAIDTFVLSIVLVYIRERYKSLWPAITLHSLKNALAFTLLFVIRIPVV